MGAERCSQSGACCGMMAPDGPNLLMSWYLPCYWRHLVSYHLATDLLSHLEVLTRSSGYMEWDPASNEEQRDHSNWRDRCNLMASNPTHWWHNGSVLGELRMLEPAPAP